MCFDKTGTLTEDSLDLYGVRPAQGAMYAFIHIKPTAIINILLYLPSLHHLLLISRFSPLVEDPCCLLPGPMLYGMATCHSLTTIEGKLTGDPLDLKMFQATKWVCTCSWLKAAHFSRCMCTVHVIVITLLACLRFLF